MEKGNLGTGIHNSKLLLILSRALAVVRSGDSANTYAVETPGFEFNCRRLNLSIDGRVHRLRLQLEQSFNFIAFSGIARVFEIYRSREWDLMKYMPARTERPPDNVLVCPMPGLVVALPVKQGERVFRGQTMVVLESMKMESDVASLVDGVAVGQAVGAGDVLIRFQA